MPLWGPTRAGRAPLRPHPGSPAARSGPGWPGLLSIGGSMKLRAVGYWVCTVLVAFSFLSGGAVDVLRVPQALEGMTHLGYPPYFMTILGVWKLGGVVILLPG